MTRAIFDAHLDLAWSAVFFNRDLTLEIHETRLREQGLTDERARGNNTVTLPELRKAGVRICVATLLARGGPEQTRQSAYKRSDLDYTNPTHAYAIAHAQLAYYRLLEAQGHIRLIRTARELDEFWEQNKENPGVAHDCGGFTPAPGTPAFGSEAQARRGEGWGGVFVTKLISRNPLPASPGVPGEVEGNGYSPQKGVTPENPAAPLGVILSMEGADPIVTPSQAQEWWQAGLRAVGLAHYGRGQYAYGTGVCGPLSPAGIELLHEFERLGMILDVTHLCDWSMAEALDNFDGRLLASHHNCRALVPGDRQLTDDQIRQLVSRGAVIGAALDAWMLYPSWVRGQTKPEVVGLDAVADHIDHVCQLAGSARHSAIGSDLDGGFGAEQTPRDLDTISDLQKLSGILEGRGYSGSDIDQIFHGNWLRLFREALPAG